MKPDHDAFFDCQFLWSMEEAAGREAYFVFEDEASEPFARTLFAAARPGAEQIAVTPSIEALTGDAPVFMEAPVWARHSERLAAAGVRGARAKVLLYFDNDPTGYWDFAKACGPHLARVFAERRLDEDSLAHLGDYMERWMGSRAVQGRLAPMPAFTVRDYPALAHENLPAIARVMAALADDESRETYARILFGRNEEFFDAFVRKVFGPQQYMEIVRLKPGDVVVNCGVGRGWEIPYFLCMTKGEGRIFNFDPNNDWPHTNYRGFIERFHDRLVEEKIIVGSHDGVVEMPISNSNMVRSDEVGQAMAASGVPTARYTCRKLDSLSAEGLFDRIDYLKMDVEGGEREILLGAMEAIKTHRPKLAVAVYHEPQHFWEYPELLMNQLENYRYYLRQYGYSRFETLLYAVPAEDLESRSGAEGLRPASVPAAAANAGWLTAYLRDRAPRAYYASDRRMLMRVHGPDWRSATIDPAPLVDTDEVAAVFEDAAGVTIVTAHAFTPGEAKLILGRSEQRATLAWTYTQGLPEGAHVAPAPGANGEAGYAIYLKDEGRAYVYAVRDGEGVPILALDIDVAPCLIERGDGAGSVRAYVAEPGGRSLAIWRYAAEGGLQEPPAEIELPGAFVGIAVVRAPIAAPPQRRLVVRVDGDGLAAVDLDGQVLARLDHDDRFDLVPTILIGSAPVA